jgi:hypothetical protein
MIWMVVVLKLPIVAALLLVWYAVKSPDPALDEDPPNGGGSDRHRGRGPRHPRPPRRGPHAATPPAPPRRVRTATPRRLTRQH